MKMSTSLLRTFTLCFAVAVFLGGMNVVSAKSKCGKNEELRAGLCYKKCKSGYKGVGPVCWQRCPKKFKDTGAHCLKPKSYGRGTGYALWHKKKCKKKHGSCEKHGALYYPKCKSGFKNFGCCVCSPRCPSGMKDIGVSCQKKSYGRGAGRIPGLKELKEFIAFWKKFPKPNWLKISHKKATKVKSTFSYSCPKGYTQSFLPGVAKTKKACWKLSASTDSGFLRKIKIQKNLLLRKYGPIIKKSGELFKKISKNDIKSMLKGSKKSKMAAIKRIAKKIGLMDLTKMLKNSNNTGKKANGDSCTSNAWCSSGVCKGGVCVENGEISTITLGLTVDVSFILGGVTYTPIMGAFRVSSPRGKSEPQSYSGVAWSVGFTFGADGSPEFGFWVDTNENLAGTSHGFVVAASYGVGLGLSFWWGYDGRFLGFTIYPQVGVGGEIEYSRGYTGKY